MFITIREIYEPFLKKMNLLESKLFIEDYGLGEPTDGMIDAMMGDMEKSYERIIAISGNSVIDITKIFTLKNVTKAQEAFEQTIPLIKNKFLFSFPQHVE